MNDKDKALAELTSIREILGEIKDLLSRTAPQVTMGAPTGTQGRSAPTFVADTLVKGIDDNGKEFTRLRGYPYNKFGVRVWPEALAALKIDPGPLKAGPNTINPVEVRIEVNDEGVPRKVLGPA